MIRNPDHLEKQLNKAIKRKDINAAYLTKLEAINSLSRILGLFEKQQYPIDWNEVNLRVRMLYLKDMPFYFYVANSMILDALYLGWRNALDESIISKIVKRSSPEVTLWRKKVLARDNKKCVECGKGKKLHAHHILHWCDYPEYRINIDNGITLCKNCHSEKHPGIKNLILS